MQNQSPSLTVARARSLASSEAAAVTGGETAVRRQGQVESFVDEVSQGLNNLEHAISAMGDRLQPVLMPSSPSESKPGAPDIHIVPVADRLRSAARQIQMLTAMVHDLTERVEA